MKKIVFIVIVVFSVVSCSISEQIIFNQDGSGKLAYTIDMSKMIAITKDLDKNKTKSMTKDLMEGTEKDMDSTISFKDLAKQFEKDGKEMTTDQLANLENMKNFSMRMVVNKANGIVKYTMYSDFKNSSEISNIGNALTTFKDITGKDAGAAGVAPDSNSIIKFSFNGNKFTRIVEQKPIVIVEDVIEEDTIEPVADSVYVGFDSEDMDTTGVVLDSAMMDTEVYYDDEVQKETISDKESSSSMEDMEEDFKKMGEMMKKGLEDSSFDFEYAFTRKIKKVSLPKSQYKLSDDKKSIFIKYQFEEFTKKIKDLNLEIEFE